MPRGGRRPGAGRPVGSTTTEGWDTLSIVLRPSLRKRLDLTVKRDGGSRSAWIRSVIERELRKKRNLDNS